MLAQLSTYRSCETPGLLGSGFTLSGLRLNGSLNAAVRSPNPVGHHKGVYHTAYAIRPKAPIGSIASALR